MLYGSGDVVASSVRLVVACWVWNECWSIRCVCCVCWLVVFEESICLLCQWDLFLPA